MSNVLDDENEEFRDQTDDMTGTAPSADFPEHTPPPPVQRKSSGRPIAPPQPVQVEEQSEVVEEQEEDLSNVLTDARLRLDQGKLYELVMNSDLFGDVDADPKAVKSVQKEIRKFAQERMEIMLGMRQEQVKTEAFPMELFPFNALEVDVLKSLAAAATKGASREAEPFATIQSPPRKQTLNTIGGPKPVAKAAAPAKPLPSKPAAPVKRPKVDAAIQRILEEEGVTLEEINGVFDPNYKPLTPKDMDEMSTEEIIERNRQAKLRTGKAVTNPRAAPMPSPEQIEAIHTVRATQAAAHPQMQAILGLLNKK